MSNIESFIPKKVTVVLKGLMVMFTNNQTECTVGLLRDVPPFHNLKIEVLRSVNGGEFERVDLFEDETAEGAFGLEVINTGKTGLRRRDADIPVDRFGGVDSSSFNWLLDFERDFFATPIGARKDAFISFLTLNNGEIFTNGVSPNHLQYRYADRDEWFHFGRVAVETGIEIDLDRPDSKALFTKAGQPIFETEANADYLIRIERTDTQHHSHIGHDSDVYFKAVGTNLRPEKQLLFRSFPPLMKSSNGSPPATPDAACPIGQLSQSNPT